MKLITRHTRAPRAGAFIRCPWCQEVSLVHHFSWAALTCQHCSESVPKANWGYCDRSEVDPASIVRLGSPVTLRDGDEWATWMPAGDCVISMYGTEAAARPCAIGLTVASSSRVRLRCSRYRRTSNTAGPWTHAVRGWYDAPCSALSYSLDFIAFSSYAL
jgi:hypothetical protein